MSTTTIELRPLRAVAAFMLGAALIRPIIPHQPGLPCPLRTLTGVPCPLCGMTRSVTSAVHFDLAASLRFSPGGVLVVLFALGLLATWLAGWRPHRISLPAWLLPAILGALWSYQLYKYATGRPL